jgi:hypothetical protein
MTELADIQARFCAGLSPFADAATTLSARELIRQQGSLSSATRLDVYRRNISGCHVTVLEQIYPVCRAILGERTFATLAREYTWRVPSAESDLNHYGATWPAFAASRLDGLAYLEDLGRLEFAWHQSWFAADDEVFDFTAFEHAATYPERLVFLPSQSLTLVCSEWPIHELWQRHRNGETPAEIDANLWSDRLVVARSGFETGVTPVSEAIFNLLSAIVGRLSLVQLDTNGLAELPSLIARGWIRGFADSANV